MIRLRVHESKTKLNCIKLNTLQRAHAVDTKHFKMNNLSKSIYFSRWKFSIGLAMLTIFIPSKLAAPDPLEVEFEKFAENCLIPT